MSTIELPDWAVPNAVQPYPIDFGLWLKPSTGAAELRVNRMGGRFGAKFEFPPLEPDAARVVVSRLLEAAYGNTLRMEFPLADVAQGSPGAPLVDGAGQAGTSLALKGLTANYQAKEGYWLTVYDQNGRGYLHNVRAPVRVAGDGTVTLAVAPMLRWPFLDGASVEMARPTIEGRVVGEPWQIAVDRLFRVGFTLEEVA